MNKESILHVGIDDTDSIKGMCTTFLAYKIVDHLKDKKVEFLDFPRLVRFNPNIPWKTRGNGAVSLKFKTKNPQKIKQTIKSFVKKYSDTKNGANPGLVFFENNEIPKNLVDFSKKALWKLISRSELKQFAKKNNLETFTIGNGQGLVGAIGAIGYEFSDHTYELLAYRKKSHFGKPRKIVDDTVKTMQEKTFPNTFNSFDTQKRRVLITPRGPDPVFYGIRGENQTSLLNASKMITTKEQLSGFMIFQSNQGTGDHLKNKINPSKLEPYSSGHVTGIISSEPRIIKGGHVFFEIDSEGTKITCAIYKPSGLTKYAKKLTIGDKIKIGGGVRKSSKKHGRVINVEFIDIIKLVPKIIESNPLCVNCKKRMKSKGINQGFECIKCGSSSKARSVETVTREIKKELLIPVVSGHRHLTRPKQRIGKINPKNSFDPSSKWFWNF